MVAGIGSYLAAFLVVHPAFFVNETLSRIDPYYLPDTAVDAVGPIGGEIERALAQLLAPPPRPID